MKVKPFHSTKPGRIVYHNNKECTEGDNIQPENKGRGTASRRLCRHCEKLR